MKTKNLEIIAKSKYIRITPRKLKLVVNATKGLSIDDTLIRLKFLSQKAAHKITLVLNQAVRFKCN